MWGCRGADGAGLLRHLPGRQQGQGRRLSATMGRPDPTQRLHLRGRAGGAERAGQPGGADDRSGHRCGCTCCPPARRAGLGWWSGVRPTRLPTGRTGPPCELRRRLVAPFGGRLREIDIQSRVQARYLRKHRSGHRLQDRVLALVGLACSGLPNMLVSDPSTGVGFRSTSRRRAYRNSSTSGAVVCNVAEFRSTSRRRAYRNAAQSPGSEEHWFRSTSRRRAYRNIRRRWTRP